MKSKNLVIASLILVVFIAAAVVVSKAVGPKKGAQKASSVSAKDGKAAAKAAVKKTISKDMGGLTIKLLNSKGKEASVRIRAYRSVDSKLSAHAASLVSNTMQELLPGSYDIVLDTIPQLIYKNIKITKGKETVTVLGALTGAINVKAQDARKKDAYYPIKILYPGSNIMVTVAATNRPLELAPGIYDVEIGTLPRLVKKGVKIENGKETALNIGCVTGILNVKAADENRKEVRCVLRVKKIENNELVASGAANRPIEVLEGIYNVEVLSTPVQHKKDVKVAAGEETNIEFLVTPSPQKVAAAPRK